MVRERKSSYVLYGLAAAGLIAVVFFLVKGCAFMPWQRSSRGIEVRVSVTRDFGRETLKDERVSVRSSGSAMDALVQVAEVETSYGGGFIHAVDGLASGYSGFESAKTDWFYYVNGQMAESGAAECGVRDGDWLIFDYHEWDYSTFTPALAGCFPEPFINGYGEAPLSCTVLFAPGWEDEARDLHALLRERGAPFCSLEELQPHWRPSEGDYAVVVGTADLLSGNPFIDDANANANRLGMYARFDGEDLVVMDRRGEESRRISSGAGLVQATGPRLGEEGSALLITGTDQEGVRAALALLLARGRGAHQPVMVLAARADRGEIDVPAR